MRNRAGTCRLSWCLCAIVALLSPSIIANGATRSTADPFQLLEEAPRHACGDEVSSLYNTIDAYYIPSYSLEWYLAQLVVTLKEELLYYHIDTDWSRDACVQVCMAAHGHMIALTGPPPTSRYMANASHAMGAIPEPRA